MRDDVYSETGNPLNEADCILGGFAGYSLPRGYFVKIQLDKNLSSECLGLSGHLEKTASSCWIDQADVRLHTVNITKDLPETFLMNNTIQEKDGQCRRNDEC